MKGDPWMSEEDFEKASQSRRRQPVVYLDGMEETDESKQRGHSLLAQRKSKRAVTSAKQKLPPVYNPVTHKFTFFK